jgi:hypothetical protein
MVLTERNTVIQEKMWLAGDKRAHLQQLVEYI